ncbi:MAG: VWA domain-containing protein [Candidatus Nanopelagicales bacterium]|nr:VWA domain-containing protein [Candidatus Nanopelagicales bacterium]
MTNSTYTHLTLVVDRSGSMEALKDEAQSGITAMLADQFAQPGRLTVNLVEFDDRIDVVARMADAAFAYALEPRGMTRLLDAVGQEIHQTGADLAALSEAERPARVVFAVVTDGEENSSHEFSIAQVRTLVERQRTQFSWQFQFLGAGESAWQGADLGMRTSRTVNSKRGEQRKYAVLNDALNDYRNADLAMAAMAMPDVIDDAV